MRYPGPPGPDGSTFRPHAALAIEVAPGKVIWYQIEIDPTEGCDIEISQDTEEIHSWEPLARVPTGPPYIRARLAGRAVSNASGWGGMTHTGSHLGGEALELPSGAVHAESPLPIEPPGADR